MSVTLYFKKTAKKTRKIKGKYGTYWQRKSGNKTYVKIIEIKQ